MLSRLRNRPQALLMAISCQNRIGSLNQVFLETYPIQARRIHLFILVNPVIILNFRSQQIHVNA